MKINDIITESQKDTHCSDKCCGADVKREDCTCPPSCEHCNCNAITEVAGAKDCWDGYKKDGTQPGTGKNKGKRVNKCVKEDESIEEVAVKPTSIKDLENLHIRRYGYNEIDDMPFIFQTELIGEKLPNESIQDTPDFEYELKMNFEKEGFDRYGKDVTQVDYDGSTLVRPGEIAIGKGEMEGGGTVLYTVVEKDAGMSDQLYPATPPRWPGDDEGNAKLKWNPKTNTWSEGSDASVDEELNNLRKRAGLEEKEKTEPCPKCGKTRHVLKACASCGCS